jgi:bifunctional UDP-N-acetylglucosamine pyrophosphorylase/glucosamine-1-phosphate N-acetyltransferase
MNRITNIETIKVKDLPQPAKQDWTAIIPAAGRGTRLGDARPKILYPILGKPILEWLVSSLDPFVDHFVFVLSHEAHPEVKRVLSILLKGRYDIAIQPSPDGMADAVWQAKPLVRTKHSIVIWGDQVALTKETIASCVHLHESRKDAALTLPTVWRKNPYIHFARDKQQRLVNVYQAREETQPLAEGENDCGIFFFNTGTLFDIIETARGKHLPIGQKTGEFNLLPLLPFFERHGGVMTLRIKRLEESFGVNTPEDARRIEDILKARISS